MSLSRGCLIIMGIALIGFRAAAEIQQLKGLGTPIVSVTAPFGSGSNNIEVIRDGVYPDAQTGTWQQSYDTFDGYDPTEVYFGYVFNESYTFTKLVFVQGVTEIENGRTFGTFADPPKIQVLVADVWTDVDELQADPAYTTDIAAFTPVTFTFTPVSGTGIRIIGMEQPGDPWVSCAELDVEGMPHDPTTARSFQSRVDQTVPRIQKAGDRITVSGLPQSGTLRITDLSGRLIRSIQYTGQNSIQIDRGTLSHGTYVVKLSTGNSGRVFSWQIRICSGLTGIGHVKYPEGVLDS